MKAKTHKLVEQILAAIGPVFKQHPEYDAILEAMSLVMARVIQATPEKGNEHLIAEDSSIMVSNALREFLKLEQAYEAEQAAKKAKLDEGINGFDRFAVVEQDVIEPGSAGDYPDNPNQNVAKTVAPFKDLDQEDAEEEREREREQARDEYTPGEGLYSQDPEPPEASQEAPGQ